LLKAPGLGYEKAIVTGRIALLVRFRCALSPPKLVRFANPIFEC
jgi:hypothetical protein